MSSAPRVILLDSNSYFRLARSIRPLLSQPFGDPPPYALKVIEDLDREFSRSHRLNSKFHWVADPEYSSDREASQYSARGKTAPQVDRALSYLVKMAADSCVDLSYIDLKVLALGHARRFPVVTDDRGMQKIAEIFGIECWPTLKLLKLMLDCGRIDLYKVKEVIEYCDAENDIPGHINDFRKLYVEIFKGQCPI